MTPSDETDTLGGRMRRYARVGRAVGGLATSLAGQRYLGVELDRSRHAGEVTEALGNLKGPLMKVAQIMSTIPDMLPEEYTKELASLQSNAPPMGWLFVRRRMNSELGAGWQDRFRSFEREAAAAASLGQVHRAVHGDGRQLACKLQYPDMKSAVEADLRQLRAALAIYHRYDKAINPADIRGEIADRLREELDYDLERRHIELYRYMLRDEAAVHVPEPVPELCTPRLLTMGWLDGARMLDRLGDDQETRNQIARNMFRAWYVPFYEYGIIHGDPHLGNYSVRDDATINLLDFGCIRIFPPSFVGGAVDLCRALETGDDDLAVHAYEGWGFTGLNREVIGILNMWAEFLYAPLLENRTRRIEDSGDTMYGARVAEKVHAELRRIGGVTPPREFVLMDRAAIGLGSVFLRLKAEVNWHELYRSISGGFSVAGLEAAQATALREAGIAPPAA